jgi:putative glycosyl hydrolase-like family 15 (GHL15) protein
MLLRRLAVLAPIALALAGGLAGRSDAAVTNVGTTRICTGCADGAGDLSRYGYVTLHAWQYDRIVGIKAANPKVKVLVYKDMASTPDYDCQGGRDDELLPSGVGYCWTLANHPDWFTVDQAGRRIEWQTWGGNWQMDVGSPGYQDQWATNVLSDLRRYGWDGVVIDDANVDESGLVGGSKMREYPTQPSYQAATRSFLARVGPRLIQSGFLVIPNIQADPVLADASLWADWIQFTSGGTRESWMKWGSGRGGHYGAVGWDDLQGVFDTVQRAGKIFLTTTTAPADDVRSMRWGRASFLVGWNGGPSAFIFDPNAPIDPWSAEWTIDVGRPIASRVRVGASVWRRDYTGGTAVVNTSEQAPQTVQLGSSYLTPEGVPITELTLKPMTGLVLRFAPGAAPPAKRALAPRAKSRRLGQSFRRLQGHVSLQAGPQVHGRVHAPRGPWQVSVYWKGARRWHIFARVRTNAHGRFRVAKPLHPTHAITLRAVARTGRAWAQSGVLRVAL